LRNFVQRESEHFFNLIEEEEEAEGERKKREKKKDLSESTWNGPVGPFHAIKCKKL